MTIKPCPVIRQLNEKRHRVMKNMTEAFPVSIWPAGHRTAGRIDPRNNRRNVVGSVSKLPLPMVHLGSQVRGGLADVWQRVEEIGEIGGCHPDNVRSRDRA